MGQAAQALLPLALSARWVLECVISNFDDVAMVKEAVECNARQELVLEWCCPLGYRAIAGDRPSFMQHPCQPLRASIIACHATNVPPQFSKPIKSAASPHEPPPRRVGLFIIYHPARRSAVGRADLGARGPAAKLRAVAVTSARYPTTNRTSVPRPRLQRIVSSAASDVRAALAHGAQAAPTVGVTGLPVLVEATLFQAVTESTAAHFEGVRHVSDNPIEANARGFQYDIP